MIYWFSGWRPSGGMVIGVDYTVGPLRAGCRPGLPAGSSDDVLTDLGRLHSGLVGDPGHLAGGWPGAARRPRAKRRCADRVPMTAGMPG